MEQKRNSYFEIQEGFLFERGGGWSLPFCAEMQGEQVGEHGGHFGGCQSVTCQKRPSRSFALGALTAIVKDCFSSGWEMLPAWKLPGR